MRRAELRRRGDRNADPQAVAREFEARRAVERRDDGGAPFTEPRIGDGARGIQRHARLLRNADCIRTGQIAGGQPDRPGAGKRCTFGHRDGHEHRVIAFIDMVHQRADHQPLRQRIERLARIPAGGEFPVELHAEPGIARIRPIAVPFGCRGREMQRHHPALARLRDAFGDQFDRHAVAAGPLGRRVGHKDRACKGQRQQRQPQADPFHYPCLGHAAGSRDWPHDRQARPADPGRRPGGHDPGAGRGEKGALEPPRRPRRSGQPDSRRVRREGLGHIDCQLAVVPPYRARTGARTAWLRHRRHRGARPDEARPARFPPRTA